MMSNDKFEVLAKHFYDDLCEIGIIDESYVHNDKYSEEDFIKLINYFNNDLIETNGYDNV